jgi:hypothetical protein
MALSNSLVPSLRLAHNITSIGNEHKWQSFLTYSDLKGKGTIVPFQTMNAFQESRGIKPFIHNFDTRWQ